MSSHARVTSQSGLQALPSAEAGLQSGEDERVGTPERTTRKRRVFLAIAAAVLAACADLNGVGISDDLAAAQARWEATHLQDYQFDFQRSCFCGPVVTSPVTITVWHGAFLSMVYRDSVSAAADTTYFQQYLTMERIFAFLHAELDAHPASFTAVYDTSSGYPRQVAVDPIANAADDEHSFVITAVRPLP